MSQRFVADPRNDAACKLVTIAGYVDGIALVAACGAAVMASLARLSDLVVIHRLVESRPLTFLSIFQVILAGVGMFLLVQYGAKLITQALLRDHLYNGTVLKLDDSIANLKLSTSKCLAAERFYLQKKRNISLRRYANRSQQK